ncbi:unnamed protein product [Rangifer tarandus platyrhynchus]|uniref:Uncharacterized protein n=2 Tax=Rangifer tarandus platyrhynchus TaxID=3082113 RepID=A0ABN8Z8R5_RANTA|nr:unnamed protein product [Rangifer tarandus platyrhynchus]
MNGKAEGWMKNEWLFGLVDECLHGKKVKSLSRVRLFVTMDCSLPGFSVHGIFQARVLEWVAISFSRRSSPLRDRTRVSRILGRRFYRLSHQGSRMHGGKILNGRIIDGGEKIHRRSRCRVC